MIPPYINGKTIGLALGSPQRMEIGHFTLMEIISVYAKLACQNWHLEVGLFYGATSKGGIIEGHQSEASN